MLITKKKRKVRLGNCPIGLFMFQDEVCLKSEYWINDRPECYIVSSGEMFCGGVSDREEYCNLMVISLNIDFKFYDKLQKAVEIIEKLEINEISKQGGISALKLVLNER